ncbi:DUF559 domain-containing protein [Micromonospora sp. NPDC126480]|uniref:DUF559 domain-containing protein n=1 Tax=Micromonospora sp. NPDC126480 TaxID=3155312 RepID=UPI00333405DD
MNSELKALVRRGDGLVVRREALGVVPRWVLDDALRAGHLVRLLPEVFADAALLTPSASLPALARVPRPLAGRAALVWARGHGALSGLTGLDVWGLRRQPDDEPVHLDVPMTSGLRSRRHLVVHHRRSFLAESSAASRPYAVTRRGLQVTRVEATLVESWPLLPPDERHGPVIRAVNEWLTTPERLRAVLASRPRMPGRTGLRILIGRLADGCRSPLEIWGHDNVFTGPGMPEFRRQARMRVGGRTMYLDLYAERERVDVELDGATTHGDRRQREVDLRRDALLATAGILTVRFSHRRLVHEPDEVRRETLAILNSRR